MRFAFRHWRLVSNVAASLGVAAFLYWAVDWPEVFGVLRSVDYRYIVPAVALHFGSIVTAAARWRLALPDTTDIGFRRLLRIEIVSLLYSEVVPGMTVYVSRPVYVAQDGRGMPLSVALSSTLVEKLYAAVMVLGAGIAGVALLWQQGVYADAAAGERLLVSGGAGVLTLVLLLTAAALVLLVALDRARRLAFGLLDRIPGPPGRYARTAAENFILGLSSIKSPTRALAALAYSGASMALHILAWLVAALSMGVPDYFPSAAAFVAAMASVPMVMRLSTMLPIPIPLAAVAVSQLSAQYYLMIMGVDPATALALSLVMKVVVMWLQHLTLGCVCLWTGSVLSGWTRRRASE